MTHSEEFVNRLTWNRTRDDRLEGGSYIRLTMSPYETIIPVMARIVKWEILNLNQ